MTEDSEERLCGISRRHLVFVMAASLSVALLLIWQSGRRYATSADSARMIGAGRGLYALHCASCHGASLEGQPDWQSPLPSGRLPAPPHDASGHTWHHADDLLFRIVKEGTAAVVGAGYESDMPGFSGVLSDAEIREVLAFIRSTWPERERRYQSETSDLTLPSVVIGHEGGTVLVEVNRLWLLSDPIRKQKPQAIAGQPVVLPQPDRDSVA